MIREEIEKLIKKAVKDLYKKEVKVKVEQPAEAVYGDYATNIAITLKKNPQEIANAIKTKIFEKIEVKNGFINFFLSKQYLQKQVGEILKQKEKFGNLKIGEGKKVNVEFISANPTGPLTLGNGRGGFCGDTLASILAKAGFKIEKEYYVNDVGEQVMKLGYSVIKHPTLAVYKGSYVDMYETRIKERDPEKVGKIAARFILEEMIKPSVKKMGIEFDNWFFESELYKKGEVAKVISFLKKKKLAYKKEGALWFKSTKFGDDKDRVLIKADGEKTYLASDIAYLRNKFRRGFKRLFFFWGADHFGYIKRIKAAAEALGLAQDNVQIIIMQLVRLMQQEKEVRMSKRSGTYITLDELIDDVGLDVARFFFLSRGADSHLDFNLDLAKEQSEKNPVYYVQYAHARICSILRKIKDSRLKTENLELLSHPSELTLIKQLIRLPEIIEDITKDYQVQRLPQYATDLATVFHRFYRDCRVISDNKELTQARLALVRATKIVLKNSLDLMGISTPEKM